MTDLQLIRIVLFSAWVNTAYTRQSYLCANIWSHENMNIERIFVLSIKLRYSLDYKKALQLEINKTTTYQKVWVKSRSRIIPKSIITVSKKKYHPDFYLVLPDNLSSLLKIPLVFETFIWCRKIMLSERISISKDSSQ
jgi:hypothetical protein